MSSKPSSEPAPPARKAPPRHKRAAADGGATPDRRQAILVAAEKLFGERGYHAVSIRDIAGEAGVPLALVGYHFGAKHELYHAIFESWQGAMSQRLEALRVANADPRAPDLLERILDAFISPVIALHALPEGRHYANMAVRDLAAPPPEADEIHRRYFDPLAHAFIDALQQVVPDTPRGLAAWGYQFALGSMLHFLSDRRVERLSHGENTAADPAAKAQLLRFIAGGFRAMLGMPPLASSPPKRR